MPANGAVNRIDLEPRYLSARRPAAEGVQQLVRRDVDPPTGDRPSANQQNDCTPLRKTRRGHGGARERAGQEVGERRPGEAQGFLELPVDGLDGERLSVGEQEAGGERDRGAFERQSELDAAARDFLVLFEQGKVQRRAMFASRKARMVPFSPSTRSSTRWNSPASRHCRTVAPATWIWT